MHPGDDFLSSPALGYDDWRDALCQDWGWHSAEPVEPAGFTGRLRSRRVCGFLGLDLTCNASGVARTARDARRDGMDHYYAAIQVAGGSTVIQNDRAVTLGAADIALVDAARPVTYAGADGYRYGQWFCLQLPRRSLVSHLGFEPKSGSCGRHGTLAGRLLQQLIVDAIPDDEGSTTPAPSDAYMQLAVYDLLGALFAPSDGMLAAPHTDKLFARICGIITARYTESNVGPGEVAAEAGISLRYLQKLFTARGSTCGHYIQSLRLDHAMRLLQRRASVKTGQPLSTIAYASGFSDYTYFARVFRRRFGHAPGAGGCGAVTDDGARPDPKENTR